MPEISLAMVDDFEDCVQVTMALGVNRAPGSKTFRQIVALKVRLEQADVIPNDLVLTGDLVLTDLGVDLRIDHRLAGNRYNPTM